MREEFQKLLEENPGIALIPKEDVSKIKIKMGKNHRKESDWIVIKDILRCHELITATPQNPMLFVSDISGILHEQGVLIAFTNFDDCEKHLKNLYEQDKRIGSLFNIASVLFLDIIEIADKNKKDLFIDIQDEPDTKFIAYFHQTKEIKAMMLGRR